ncbi:IS481 family transposase [bacterium]|nr:MAG: IS481 family transposase [bacterium]
MSYFGFNWQFNWVSRYGNVELTAKERDRLRALALWEETKDVKLVCRTFQMSQAALYRWRNRFNPYDLSSLKERSRRPKRLRSARWPLKLIQDLKQLRETYPRWGKDKLVVLLRSKGHRTSTSTVGRILSYLKKHGRLIEPKRTALRATRHRRTRPYAIRKPKEYRATRPGDLVEVDTLDVRPLPKVILKQFTARDVVSRWDVLEAHHQATASLAAKFLDTLKARTPFPIRALQVDGGSEFYADFEAECQRRKIRLFVLPPKSPKLNGAVERANRTHTEEFYQVNECAWTVEELNPQLIEWERIYNTVRPHQSLNYLTPLQFLQQHGIVGKNYPSHSHMW